MPEGLSNLTMCVKSNPGRRPSISDGRRLEVIQHTLRNRARRERPTQPPGSRSGSFAGMAT